MVQIDIQFTHLLTTSASQWKPGKVRFAKEINPVTHTHTTVLLLFWKLLFWNVWSYITNDPVTLDEKLFQQCSQCQIFQTIHDWVTIITTTTLQQPFYSPLSWTTRESQYQRNIHPHLHLFWLSNAGSESNVNLFQKAKLQLLYNKDIIEDSSTPQNVAALPFETFGTFLILTGTGP